MDETPDRITSSRAAQKLPEIESNAKFPHTQDFPQVLRIWGRLFKIWWESNAWGEQAGGGSGAENGILKI